MAKSMSVVVPPKAAAMVPVSKSSALVVPPKGMSRCVCTSIPPGMTRRPEASMTRPAFSTGSGAAMAEILSPLMPISAAYVSEAVTIVPFRITVLKRMPGPRVHLMWRTGSRARVARQNLAAINFQSLLFFAAHEVDIKLGDANGAQGPDFPAVLLDGPDQAEAVNDLIGDKIGVVAANFAVVKIIILAAILHERGQSWRKFFGLIF